MPTAGRDGRRLAESSTLAFLQQLVFRFSKGEFSTSDREGSIPVMIINKTMADRRWPVEALSVSGSHIPGPGDVQASISIVGVAETRGRAIDEPPSRSRSARQSSGLLRSRSCCGLREI